jgi:hypothetical protein
MAAAVIGAARHAPAERVAMRGPDITDPPRLESRVSPATETDRASR